MIIRAEMAAGQGAQFTALLCPACIPQTPSLGRGKAGQEPGSRGPHLAQDSLCPGPFIHTQPRSQGCHVRGSGWSIGAESSPWVVPRREWHILGHRRCSTQPYSHQALLSPSSPPMHSTSTPTLQPLHIPSTPSFSLKRKQPHRPSLKTPTYPLSHLLNHIPCIHHSPHLQHTLATHSSQAQPCIPKPYAHTQALTSPVL